MQVVIPVGYRKNFPVTRHPQAFLKVASNQLFESIIDKLRGHEIIVVSPFPKKYFKDYEVQVVEDEGSGSASSLKAVEKIIDDTFVMHYSDIFTPFRIEPLIEFHKQKGGTIFAAVAVDAWRRTRSK